MTLSTRGLAAAVVLAAGACGCTLPAKRKPPESPVKPLSISPPKLDPPVKDGALPAVQPTGRNGTLNVPGQPTSGGTLRPTPPANPSIESPVVPTVTPNPAPAPAGTPKPDAGSPVPPPPPPGIDPMNIAPPTPAKLDLPSLPN
jgi:hypothetical protein